MSAAAGGMAGIIALLADTHALFDKAPMLGFICMGLLGGFAGWALMLDLGKLDGKSPGVIAVALLRRIILGLCIGIAAGISWGYFEGEARGIWMLGAGVAATAPVEVMCIALDILPEPIKAIFMKKATKA